MTPETLREIEERANAATPGPWLDNGVECVTDAVGFVIADFDNCDCLGENMDFIRHARSDVPALISEVRRLQKVEKNLSDEVTHVRQVLKDHQAVPAVQDRDNEIQRRAEIAKELHEVRQENLDLTERLTILRRYHWGDGTITKERVMRALGKDKE